VNMMLRKREERVVGAASAFPNEMEQRISRYLQQTIPALPIDQVLVGLATAAP